MRRLSILLILFVTSDARVTFPFSEVLQDGDSGVFNCPDGCTVYAGQMNEQIFSKADQEPVKIPETGLVLPAGDYTWPNTRDRYSYNDRINDILLYVVASKAPNYGSKVFVPQRVEMEIRDQGRYITLLSSSEALEFYNFRGIFPPGYPRIYGAGFDAVSDIYGETSCKPIYQARSQLNAEQSRLTVTTSVVTIDFGYIGEHSVTAIQKNGNDYHKNAISSTVYMSPGHIGCPFSRGQLYKRKGTSSYVDIKDSFMIVASGLDISAYYLPSTGNQKVKLRVNDDILDFYEHVSFVGRFSKHYGKGAFNIDLSHYSTSSTSSWAMQFDFGVEQRAGIEERLDTTIAPKEAVASAETLCPTAKPVSLGQTTDKTEPTATSRNFLTKFSSLIAEIIALFR